MCLSFALATFAGAESSSDPGVIMAWTGQSELGYLRVELWTPDAKEPGAARLVIKCATLAGITTHQGQMVRLPDDIRTDPDVDHLFVASSEDMSKNARHGSPVLASLAADGTLRLYSVGPCVFRTRPNLKPT